MGKPIGSKHENKTRYLKVRPINTHCLSSRPLGQPKMPSDEYDKSAAQPGLNYTEYFQFAFSVYHHYMQSKADQEQKLKGAGGEKKIGMMQRQEGGGRRRRRGNMTKKRKKTLRLSAGSYQDTLMVMNEEV